MVTPKTLIIFAYVSFVNIHKEKYGARASKIIPTIAEQIIETFNAVLNNDFSFGSSPAYSAVYFTTPEFIAPFAKVKMMLIKFEKAPISATPAGPVNRATTLLATNPETMRINVIIAEKKVTLTNFKMMV
jgi:hypothetical protein